jgi:hypothetical protein
MNSKAILRKSLLSKATRKRVNFTTCRPQGKINSALHIIRVLLANEVPVLPGEVVR